MKKKYLVNYDSGYRVLESFNYERETMAYGTCSVVLSGKMWVFGGYDSPYKRQLSSVQSCYLKTEGKLSFDFNSGACNVLDGFNNEQTALLCFHDSSPYTECHR